MQSVTAKTTNTKVNNDLKEAFALWEQKSKSGVDYFTGKTSDKNPIRLVAFINGTKKNPKQPDISIYEKVAKDEKPNQIASLWEQQSKTGKSYLSGTTNDNEKIIAFYNDNTQDGKYPIIRAYFKSDVK